MSLIKSFNPFDVCAVFSELFVILFDIEEFGLQKFIHTYSADLTRLMKVLLPEQNYVFVIVGASTASCIVMSYLSTMLNRPVRIFLPMSAHDQTVFSDSVCINLEIAAEEQVAEFMKCLANGIICMKKNTVSYEETQRKPFDYKYFCGCKINNKSN